jgi:hypothetical protein
MTPHKVSVLPIIHLSHVSRTGDVTGAALYHAAATRGAALYHAAATRGAALHHAAV